LNLIFDFIFQCLVVIVTVLCVFILSQEINTCIGGDNISQTQILLMLVFTHTLFDKCNYCTRK
jgi:hypothetical protein